MQRSWSYELSPSATAAVTLFCIRNGIGTLGDLPVPICDVA